MVLQASLRSQNQLSSLVELLQQRAQHQPGQKAYTFLVDGESEEIHLSYAELDRQARTIAAHLQTFVPPGARALLVYPQGLDFIAAFFGCLYAGIIAVPADLPRRNQKLSRLQSIVADAQPTVALTTTALLTDIEQRFNEVADIDPLKWIATDRLSPILADDWQSLHIESDTLAFLQYTSGSTGTPKGVMVSHGNILHNSEHIKQAFESSSERVAVTWLPSFHDMGLIGGIIQPLYAGCLSVILSPTAFIQKPIRWLWAISRYKATDSGGPNLGYELCIQKITFEELQSIDLSHWRCAYIGAEPVRKQTLEQFANKFATCGFKSQAFYPCYGMAEATLIVTGGSLNKEPIYYSVQAAELEQNNIVESDNPQKSKHFVGCGHAWLDTQVVIVDPKTLTTCPPNRVGEVWVASASVTKGYWNQPEETEQTFQAYLTDTQAGPFLRTGDLGFLRDGELLITGRNKDVIIIRGRNHYPQDIELTVSQSHPALRSECGAAFSVEVDGSEQLVIIQEVERSYLRDLDVDEVAKAIRQAVFEQHELQIYAVVLLKTASILKTSSGKIQRHACRRDFLAGNLNVVGEHVQEPQIYSMDVNTIREATDTQNYLDQDTSQAKIPLTSILTEESIQDWLINRLSELAQLDPDEIDITDSFAQYGLDSSVTVSLTVELGNWLGCELEPTVFWEYPNIEILSKFLKEQTSYISS